MHTFIRILASDLNIFISTGSKTREYKKVLAKEIEAQSLNYNIIEDISRSSEINAVIYADDSDISDFSVFPDDTVIFSIFAGVEKTLLNKTIQQPLVRLIDVEMKSLKNLSGRRLEKCLLIQIQKSGAVNIVRLQLPKFRLS